MSNEIHYGDYNDEPERIYKEASMVYFKVGPQHVFMAWCLVKQLMRLNSVVLIKHRVKFTLNFYVLSYNVCGYLQQQKMWDQ
jgi:hypothetical protein